MVRYPYMREALLETIHKLANREYQHRAWVNQEFPDPNRYDCFDNVVHFLFDDSYLADDAERTIGAILENEKEAEVVQRIINSINIVLKKLGTEASDEEYINCPEWDDVVVAATVALEIFDPD